MKKIMLPINLVLIWGLCNISKRYFATNYDLNVIVFTLVSLLTTSIILIFYGKTNQSISKQALKEKYTWWFAVFDILYGIFTMILFAYVSSTKASLLEQLSAVVAILTSYLFFNKKPRLYDIAGCLLILSGIFHVIGNLDGEIFYIIAITTGLNAIINTGKTLTAELNPINLTFLDLKAKFRVTGIVTLFSTFAFTVFILIFSLIKLSITTNNVALNYIFNLMPSLSDFTNFDNYYTGFLYGILFLTTARYLYFYASKVASTDNVLIIYAMTPFVTWIFEYIFAQFGHVDISNISTEDLIWGTIITSGALVMTIGRTKRAIKEEREQKLSAE